MHQRRRSCTPFPGRRSCAAGWPRRCRACSRSIVTMSGIRLRIMSTAVAASLEKPTTLEVRPLAESIVQHGLDGSRVIDDDNAQLLPNWGDIVRRHAGLRLVKGETAGAATRRGRRAAKRDCSLTSVREPVGTFHRGRPRPLAAQESRTTADDRTAPVTHTSTSRASMKSAACDEPPTPTVPDLAFGPNVNRAAIQDKAAALSSSPGLACRPSSGSACGTPAA